MMLPSPTLCHIFVISRMTGQYSGSEYQKSFYPEDPKDLIHDSLCGIQQGVDDIAHGNPERKLGRMETV